MEMRKGLTLRSLAVALFAIVVMAMHVQYVEVILADGSAVAEQALPIPAVTVFLGLLLVVAGLRWLARVQLLEKAELFCILLILLIATPIMTQGMWHRFVGLIAATPRSQNFAYVDALNDKLWPHGPNLLAGRFASATARGNPAQWDDVDLNDRLKTRAATLRNTKADEVSALDLTVPVTSESGTGIVPGEPYLVSVLARGEDFSPATRVFIRVYDADGQRYTELASSADEKNRTFLHPQGFIRVGTYRVTFPVVEGQRSVSLAFGLSGPGKLILADPKLFSVGALEWAYSGRAEVTEAVWNTLAPQERAGLVVRPANLWSWAGLKYVVAGYIPVAAWMTPAVAWSSLVILLLAATLAIAVLMRRHWADSQRYPFPNFQIPALWLNEGAAVWKNRMLWVGFGIGLAWCLARGWHFYNPRVPNLEISVPLGQYLNDPGWGGMWQTKIGRAHV